VTGPYTRAVPERRQATRALGLATAVLVVIVVALTVAGMHWFYPRLVTTAARIGVAIVATGLAWRLLPRRWRPRGVLPFVVGCVAAYALMEFGRASEWSSYLDHQILTPPGGEVDEVSTWAFGVLGAAGLLGLVAVVTGWLSRRSTADRSR
jgi:hypothetical protein